jgi:hypothetical protein
VKLLVDDDLFLFLVYLCIMSRRERNGGRGDNAHPVTVACGWVEAKALTKGERGKGGRSRKLLSLTNVHEP